MRRRFGTPSAPVRWWRRTCTPRATDSPPRAAIRFACCAPCCHGPSHGSRSATCRRQPTRRRRGDRVDATIAEDDLDFFKIVYDDLPPGSPHLSREALVGAIEAARKQGVRAIVHATMPDDALTAVEAGASLLVHVPQRGILTQE